MVSIAIPWTVYSELWSRVKSFYNDHNRLPNYAKLTIDNKDYHVLRDDLEDVGKRVAEFIRLNKRNPFTVSVTVVPLRNPGPIQVACEKLLGEFNSLTEFANKCRGRGYGNYYNDIKTLAQEYTTIKDLNCTDSTQLLVHLATEMGYDAHYVHIKCLQSGGGHVIAKVKGKEFKGYTFIDLAAMMSTKTMATIGRGWCFDAIPVNGRVDPSWLTRPDDGIT